MLNLTHSDIQLFYSGLGLDAFTLLTDSILSDPQPAIPFSSFIPQDSPLDGPKNLSKRKVVSSESHLELNRSQKRIKTPSFPTPSKKSSNRLWDDDMIDKLIDAVKTEGKKWQKVAAKIEGVTDTQCRYMWKKMHQDTEKPPCKGMKWTNDQIGLLRGAVEAVGTNWEKVAELIKGVTALQCRRKWNNIKNNIIKGSWTKEEDKQLRKAVENYGEVWTKVAAQISTRNNVQCNNRWEIIKNRTPEEVDDQSQSSFPPAASSMSTDSLFPELNELPVLTFLPPEVPSAFKIMDSAQTVKRGFWRNKVWNDDMIDKLIDAVKTEGKKWKKVAAKIEGVTDTQCQDKWYKIKKNIIKDPRTKFKIMKSAQTVNKGFWENEEDQRLIKAVEECGTQWREVALRVSTRNGAQCSKRWEIVDPKCCDKSREINKKFKRRRWSNEEDEQLLIAVEKYGMNNWKLVASEIPQRNRNNCYRRWETINLKKLLGEYHLTES